MKAHLLLFFMGILLSLQAAGQYTSKDNYTGWWEETSTWTGDPANVPGYTGITEPVTIKGFVQSNESLSFDVQGDALTVQDTLIVYGDLSFANKNDLVIEEGGVLIVYGNLSATNQIEMDPQGYLVVKGDLVLTQGNNQVETTNGGDNIFVGGNITPEKRYEGSEEFSDTADVSQIGDEDPGLEDIYTNNGIYKIRPDSTIRCSGSGEAVNLYLSGGSQADAIDSWQKSTNPSDENSWNNVDETGSTSYTVQADALPNEGEALYYRVQYTVDGTPYISDTAVVYCGSLCTMNASIDLKEGWESPTCYSEGVSFRFTSTITEGTAPYTYSWQISPSGDPQDPNPNITISEDSPGEATFSGFSNPGATTWEYTVTLTVEDNEACSATASQTIILQRRPVTGNAYYVPNDFDQQ